MHGRFPVFSCALTQQETHAVGSASYGFTRRDRINVNAVAALKFRLLTLRLERDDFSSNRHPALGYCWSMIFSENRYPLFGIML